ncbi:MAG: hypothetical protein Q9223_004351, partial [Gallowayella weberi]
MPSSPSLDAPATLGGLTIPTETSSTAPWSTLPEDGPSQTPQPAYTVINDVVALKACLDSIIGAINLPPKTYSQAHSHPPTNTPYSRTDFELQPWDLPSQPAPLFNITQSTPELYIDAEGISLSRSRELSIPIVHVETLKLSHTYLIHVHVLGALTFTTLTTNDRYSLKSILEDNRIAKVLFDCRMDSDALHGQYKVLLGGVIDLQLMHLAVQGGGGRRLPGLEHCLRTNLTLTREEQEWVLQAKRKGQVLWRPRMGGSLERFNDNPLHEDVVRYCVVDAAYLPRLFEKYNWALGYRVCLTAVDELWGNENLPIIAEGVFSWECRVLKHSRERVLLAKDLYFYGGTARNP